MPGIHLSCIYSWKNYKPGLSKKGLELSVSRGMHAEGLMLEWERHPLDGDCNYKRKWGAWDRG